jgi:ABC-type Zn uptake system ZnuABC Zn-binding protein ZnuA
MNRFDMGHGGERRRKYSGPAWTRASKRWAHAAFGLALVAFGLVLGACGRKAGPRLKVAVTIFPIYDLSQTIAGPDADVVLLVPPGLDVHDASAPPEGALSGARLGIMVGLGLDEWMKPLLERAAPSAHRLVVGDRVPTIPMRLSPEANPDPHVWLDPERAMLISKAIAEEMARVDPPHASAYRSRSFALQQDLDALDREIEERVATWVNRSFVSFHPAFAYYADRYHLDVAASVEPAAGIPPTPESTREILRILRAKRIAGVFREPQLPSEPAAAVAEAAGVSLGVLDPVGGGAETDTYDKLLRFDTDALEKVMKSASPPMEPGGTPSTDGSSPP